MKLITIITPQPDLSGLHQLCQATDIILLRQDAVYLCLRNDIHWPTQHVYALGHDMSARQLPATTLISSITNERWVELCSQAEQHLLWQS